MRYKVLDRLKAQTAQGEVELQPGQVIALPIDKALILINKGKLIPIERTALKVYSEILQTHLWLVATDEDREALGTSQNVTEAIYTAGEVRRLKGIDEEGLKTVHRVKEIFEDSKVKSFYLTFNHHGIINQDKEKS